MSEQTKRGLTTIVVLSVLNGLAIGFLGNAAGFVSGGILAVAFILGERNAK